MCYSWLEYIQAIGSKGIRQYPLNKVKISQLWLVSSQLVTLVVTIWHHQHHHNFPCFNCLVFAYCSFFIYFNCINCGLWHWSDACCANGSVCRSFFLRQSKKIRSNVETYINWWYREGKTAFDFVQQSTYILEINICKLRAELFLPSMRLDIIWRTSQGS